MARHNKIFAGPFTEATPQVHEALASANILPGSPIVLNSSGKFAPAGAVATDKIYIAQEDYLTMRGVDDIIKTDENVIGLELLDEQFFNVRVAPSQTIVVGSKLTTNAAGAFVVATTGQRVIVVAEEALTTAAGSLDLVRVRKSHGETVAA